MRNTYRLLSLLRCEVPVGGTVKSTAGFTVITTVMEEEEVMRGGGREANDFQNIKGS